MSNSSRCVGVDVGVDVDVLAEEQEAASESHQRAVEALSEGHCGKCWNNVEDLPGVWRFQQNADETHERRGGLSRRRKTTL